MSLLKSSTTSCTRIATKRPPLGRTTAGNPFERLQVAKVVDVTKMRGYDPAITPMIQRNPVGAEDISIKETVTTFPGLAVYSYWSRELIKIVDAADIYDSRTRGKIGS